MKPSRATLSRIDSGFLRSDFFFFQAEDGIRDLTVTGVQTCALPILMDTTTYEQHTLDAEAVGDHADWLQPEMHIQVEWLNGRPVGIELPSVVELTVVQTSPVMRGATKTASTKPAKLSNGVTIQVPEFISEGEKVRVDPREG